MRKYSNHPNKADLMTRSTEVTKCAQVNLHCARAAAASTSHLIAREGIGIGLIQKPWAPKEEVLGINLKGHTLTWCKNEGRPRAPLVIDNNIKYVCLSEFLTRDLVPLEANILVGGIFKKWSWLQHT